MTVGSALRLGLLAVSLLAMGSTAFRCSSGEQGLLAGVATGDLDDDHAPSVEDFTIEAEPNLPAQGFLRGTDPDGDALTFSIVAGPANGIVDLTDPASGAFTYVAGVTSGVDGFSYRASDGVRDSPIGIVTVEIGAAASLASLAELRARF
jgi:hypothetical protein